MKIEWKSCPIKIMQEIISGTTSLTFVDILILFFHSLPSNLNVMLLMVGGYLRLLSLRERILTAR